MRKFILLALSAVMLLLAVGCTAGGVQEAAAVPSQSDASDNTLGITLTAEDVTPTGLTLVCTHSGGAPTGELHTGSYYSIERFTADGWKAVDYANGLSVEDVAWTEEAWIIDMEGVTRWEMSWEWLYGELSPGWYRVGKEIIDFRGTGDYDKHMTYAVFEIAE